MTTAIDTVLARLPDPRPTGRDRWRCACPAHGGANKSTLSVGVTDDGAVLLRCWAGCDIEAIVGALGLTMHELWPAKTDHHTPGPRRRNMISAQQALDVLVDEAHLAWLAAANIAHGTALSEDDRARLLAAAARIAVIAAEVRA